MGGVARCRSFSSFWPSLSRGHRQANPEARLVRMEGGWMDLQCPGGPGKEKKGETPTRAPNSQLDPAPDRTSPHRKDWTIRRVRTIISLISWIYALPSADPRRSWCTRDFCIL